MTARGVEIFHKSERIAGHIRASGNRKHTTVSEHMPFSHRRYAGWTIGCIRETPARSARRPRRCANKSSRLGPSRAGLSRLSRHRAAALSARRGSRPPPSAPSRSAAEPMARSNPSSMPGSIGDPRQRAPRHRPDPLSQHPRAALLPLGDANVLKHPTLDQFQHPRPRWNGQGFR